jgi:hypothetical protein
MESRRRTSNHPVLQEKTIDLPVKVMRAELAMKYGLVVREERERDIRH